MGSSGNPWMIATLALAVVAIICGVWALNLQSRVQSLESDLSTVRANANATRYTLEASANAPQNARGEVWLSPSGSGVITVGNLPAAGDNEEYVVWMQTDDGDPVRGGIISIDSAGQGYALVPADSAGITRIGISLEQRDAIAPAGEYLLSTDIASSRG